MAFRPHIGIFNLSPWKIGEWHFGSDAAAMKTSLPDQLIGKKGEQNMAGRSAQVLRMLK